MCRTRRLRPRPAGAPEASLSARSWRQAAPSFGPELRPASANQPLGPRWPALSGFFRIGSLRVVAGTMLAGGGGGGGADLG